MKCKRCPEGRRYAIGSTLCRFYGIIVMDEHECNLERGKMHERNGNYRHEGYNGAEIHDDGGFFIDSVPGVLPEPGERGGISEMEERRKE